jgi:SAM-dependent methyltransferase
MTMNFNQIKNYWDKRAAGDDSEQSTTQDVYLREIEATTLASELKKLKPNSTADIGCGDGRTTLRVARQFHQTEFFGYDYSGAMITNAKMQLSNEINIENINFAQADILNDLPQKFDSLYTTRCLINLPAWELQQQAISNICDALNDNGVYIMIENFVEGQMNFNRVRKEYELPEIPIREHNLFFERKPLLSYLDNYFHLDHECNISSTYYLMSRILYSKICADTDTLPDYYDVHHRLASKLPFSGEYGPVRLLCLRKK